MDHACGFVGNVFFSPGTANNGMLEQWLEKIAIVILVVSVLMNLVVYKYFYNTYMLPGAFDWPLNDEEARKILLKQQEVLKQAFVVIAVPLGTMLLMQLARLVQLIISKPSHADSGQPTS
jgi:hypothetical protein